MFIVDYDNPNGLNQGVYTRHWLPYNFTLCKDNRDNGSTLITEKAWVLTDTNFNYIVLCQTALNDTSSLKSNGDRQKNFNLQPSANVEILMQYISATLFHMLLHVYFRLESKSIVLLFLHHAY
jgi:hypothetical protein